MTLVTFIFFIGWRNANCTYHHITFKFGIKHNQLQKRQTID